jgi:hypothetical protein
MVKKKKPKLLDELEKIIINKHHLLNIPTNDKILKLNTFKYGSDFDVNVHKCNNIIPDNNIIKFDKNEPTKDNMFKTFKYTLNPDKSQFKLLLGFCDAYIEMYNLTIKKIKEERKIQRNIQNKNIKYCEMTYKPNIGILKKYFVNDKETLNKKYKINNIEYIKVENDDNKVLMMPLKEINEIDKHFSVIYNYPIEKNIIKNK